MAENILSNFVYKWTDNGVALKHRYYIGSHKGAPDDGYVSSSKYFNEQYHIRPADFTREILVSFDEYSEAHDYETKLLNSVDARRNPLYYNQSNNTPGWYNKGHTEATKAKLRISLTGRIFSEEAKEKMSRAALGKLVSEETKAKMGVAKRGKTFTEAHKAKLRDSHIGRTHTEATKAKLRAMWQKRKAHDGR